MLPQPSLGKASLEMVSPGREPQGFSGRAGQEGVSEERPNREVLRIDLFIIIISFLMVDLSKRKETVSFQAAHAGLPYTVGSSNEQIKYTR